MTPDILLRIAAVVFTLIVTLSGGWFWAIKWLLDRTVKRIEKDINTLVNDQRQLERNLEEQKLELAKYQVHVAENYVGREDWVRFRTEISRKLDQTQRTVEEIRAETVAAHGKRAS